MKKSFVLTAIALLTLALSACNNSASSNNSSTQSNNNSNEVWYETYYIARYKVTVPKGANAKSTDSDGYATEVNEGYLLINGYAVRDTQDNKLTVSFISENENKTEAYFYMTTKVGYHLDACNEPVHNVEENRSEWRWRINEETDHWQCSSPDWNK